MRFYAYVEVVCDRWWFSVRGRCVFVGQIRQLGDRVGHPALEANGEESGPVILDMRRVELTWFDESVPKAVKRFARGRMR